MENTSSLTNEKFTGQRINDDIEMMEQKNNQPIDDNHASADLEEVDMNFMLIEKLGRDLSMNCLIRCPRFEYGVIASLNKCFRALVESRELDKLRRSLGFLENVIFFSGGTMDWKAFLPGHSRWLEIPLATCDGCFSFSEKESLAVGSELLVFGRALTSNMVLKYNIYNNTWKSGNPPSLPRCFFGSASFKEICILAGGCDRRGNTLNSAEMYNSVTGQWTPINNMNIARQQPSCFFMDDKFYVIGGFNENSGEFYDFTTRTWTLVPNMYPRLEFKTGDVMSLSPLAAVVKNELYIADHIDLMLKKYIKTNNSWVTIGKLPTSISSVNGWGLAFKGCGDRLIIIDGPGDLNRGFLKIYAWIPNEGQLRWNQIGVKHWYGFVYNCAVMQC